MSSLAAIMRNGKDATRVAAAAILLDRGWGKPAQPHTGEDEGHQGDHQNITEGKP